MSPTSLFPRLTDFISAIIGGTCSCGFGTIRRFSMMGLPVVSDYAEENAISMENFPQGINVRVEEGVNIQVWTLVEPEEEGRCRSCFAPAAAGALEKDGLAGEPEWGLEDNHRGKRSKRTPVSNGNHWIRDRLPHAIPTHHACTYVGRICTLTQTRTAACRVPGETHSPRSISPPKQAEPA
ncbi:hypothetical protein NDU88_006199 [Pleurodeles waltl]|uniref:Uncharacterized protein n=1 Tax=Pleurodeles waltl TaxID=8319 RepID=A0AAV7TWY2_PLEWA|nr:hypothetical protein NDU88_006199 [Pleurodeles waltl]